MENIELRRILADSTGNLLPLVLSVEQVAEALGIGRTKAYELVHTNQLTSLKMGRLRRVRQSDLARYIEELARRSGND